jgi:hypothetical protein
MDSVSSIDQDLVTDAVRTLALNTLTAYQNGVSLKWNDAELAISYSQFMRVAQVWRAITMVKRSGHAHGIGKLLPL